MVRKMKLALAAILLPVLAASCATREEIINLSAELSSPDGADPYLWLEEVEGARASMGWRAK